MNADIMPNQVNHTEENSEKRDPITTNSYPVSEIGDEINCPIRIDQSDPQLGREHEQDRTKNDKTTVSEEGNVENIRTEVEEIEEKTSEEGNVENIRTEVEEIEEKTEKKDFPDPVLVKCIAPEVDLDAARTVEIGSQQQLPDKNDQLNGDRGIVETTVDRCVTPVCHEEDEKQLGEDKDVLKSDSPNKYLLSDDLDILLARHKLISQQLEQNGVSMFSKQVINPSETDLCSTHKHEESLDTNKHIENTSDADDIDDLLYRHELIQQQLNMENDKDNLVDQAMVFENVGKRKRKGKKKKKTKFSMGNSSSRDTGNSISLLTSSVTNNNKDESRKSEFTSDSLDDVINEELFVLRNKAITHPSVRLRRHDINVLKSTKKPPKHSKIKRKSTNKISFSIPFKNGPSSIPAKKSKFDADGHGRKLSHNDLAKTVLYKNNRKGSSVCEGTVDHGKIHRNDKAVTNNREGGKVLTKSASKRQRRRKAKRQMQTSQVSKPLKGKAPLLYSAQEEREVKLLQKQQEEMVFDNYSNIPMDIDDDDAPVNTDKVIAPLPLIEMPEVRPPPPPQDDFKPVEDRAALCMTSSNVAWMPGFVETLDIDSNLSTKVEVIKVSRPNVDKEKSSSNLKTEESNEKIVDDDADVWALRAQALKSLACKRAVRAKELNKNKKIKSKENIGDAKQDAKIENVPLPEIRSPEIRSPEIRSPDIRSPDIRSPDIRSPDIRSPVIPGPSRTADVKKGKVFYTPPPKHPQVIIQLGQHDFESESDSDDSKYISERQLKIKVIRRRKAVHDETLLRDLLGYIKRCRLRMKKNSSSIVKDQLIYKKLQNEISKQKILFEEQKEYIKKLQEELNCAIKRKTATCKTHNKLQLKTKKIKDQLKEKIQVRNTTDERILRAKTIVSVNRLRGNIKGNINPRLKSQILMLVESLKDSHQALLNAEKSYDKSTNVVINSKPLESNEIDNDAVGTFNSVGNENTEKKTSSKLRLGLHEELSLIDGSPNTEVINTGSRTAERESTPKDLFPPGLILRLEELRNSFSATSECDETLNTVYTLSELLQHNAESPRVIKIKNENNSNDIWNNFISHVPAASYVHYKSPLTCFRSYRLSPRFISYSTFSIRSATVSNAIQPHMSICHYDLLGTCNDSNCTRTHLDEKCIISTHALINDLLAYQLSNFAGWDVMTDADKQRLLNLYTDDFMKNYGGKFSLDDNESLLWNQLREFCRNKKKEIVDFVILDDRRWFYEDAYMPNENNEEFEVDHYTSKYGGYAYSLNKGIREERDCINSISENQDELRYFSKKYNSIELLKKRLGENTSDVKLWLSLVQQILNSEENYEKGAWKKKLSSNALEYALSVLSRALEENTCSTELWIRYLHLFSLNHTPEELRELCYQAVMYAADYDVWWTCLSLETTVVGKQEICIEMIKFIKDSQLSCDRKSHYLTETILYAIRLLTCCEKIIDGINYINVALGITALPDNDCVSIAMTGISKNLNRQDKSLLWLCLISLYTFKNVPKCIFKLDDSGPGRVVNKENFLLDWQDGSWGCSEEKVRLLFKEALFISETKTVSLMKDMIILYENVVAFELSLGNIDPAFSVLRELLSELPSFIDGWKLLMLLNIQFLPIDEAIRVGEEGINNCKANAKLVYFFCKELLKRDQPDLAMKILWKCVRGYFKNDDIDESHSIVEQFKRIIKLSLSSPNTSLQLKNNDSENILMYYCLCYCLLTVESLQVPNVGCNINTSEAFEYVIHLYHSTENIKGLWIAYIEYKVNLLSNMTIISSEEYQSFIDLLYQSLASVPSIRVVKENPNLFWRDYEFHNKLIDMCLTIIPIDEHSKIYQKLINFMPDNIPLALRICTHEFEGGNYEQARIICSSLLSEFSNCLPLWNMAIKMELKCKNVKEARWLLLEGTKALPFCLTLWKKLVKFEVSYSTDFGSVKIKLEEILKEASIKGLNLQDVISKLQREISV